MDFETIIILTLVRRGYCHGHGYHLVPFSASAEGHVVGDCARKYLHQLVLRHKMEARVQTINEKGEGMIGYKLSCT
jgi:uncharacterized protein YcfJ